MRRRLSERQRQILEFIRRYIEENGIPPSVRDIQRALNISSTSVVDYNLRILQREGYINRKPEIARGIELPDAQATTAPRVPLVGTIAAGQPIPDLTAEGWATQPLDYIEVPGTLLRRGRRLFALRVRGQSMIDALIDDGDIVLVEPATDVRDGDMVVAWLRLEKEATLKHIFREGDRVRLQPANSQMSPIYTRADNVEVQGRVVGVVRILA